MCLALTNINFLFMNPSTLFEEQVQNNIQGLGNDLDLQALSRIWSRLSNQYRYTYNFKWMGRPIIQYPQDMTIMQELIWEVKPDLIIETGIAHGGSLIFSASMQALLDLCDATESEQTVVNLKKSKRMVLGIDIDIRTHNRSAIQAHPLASRIQMIEGSSIDSSIIDRVKSIAGSFKCVLVSLDSNHTHEHVLAELEAYAPLTSIGSYCIVFDTLIEDMPAEMFHDRPWGPGNNPKTAVREYLRVHPEFASNSFIENKALITVAPGGFLCRKY